MPYSQHVLLINIIKNRLKVRTVKGTMALFKARIQVFICIFLSLATYSILYQYFMIFRPDADENELEIAGPLPEVYDRHYLEQLQLPDSYQCALVWLRLPKTASTTVIRRFVTPFVKNANLQHAELGPNTCVTHIGGCTDLWQGWETNRSQWEGIDEHSIAPPFGVSLHNNSISRSDGNNQRCFPDKGAKTKLYCWEFDSNHSTLFYGPHHYSKRKKRKTKLKRKGIEPSMDNNTFTTADFDLYPSLHTHVAIDTSLFGWIIPETPMVFSTFRDPVDRLLSSFHYGIQFGGGPPGLVRRCKLPGVNDLDGWQSRIITAREVAALNDLSLYQQALQEYLSNCENAVDNAYVQFLDPKTKDVDVALAHLNKYVIVGMQTDLDESLERWTKMALWSCREHPKATQIGRALTNPANLDSHFRDSSLLANSTGTELASPTIDELDLDLQQLLRKLTAGDEVIFRRAQELYEEQGHWFETKE